MLERCSIVVGTCPGELDSSCSKLFSESSVCADMGTIESKEASKQNNGQKCPDGHDIPWRQLSFKNGSVPFCHLVFFKTSPKEPPHASGALEHPPCPTNHDSAKKSANIINGPPPQHKRVSVFLVVAWGPTHQGAEKEKEEVEVRVPTRPVGGLGGWLGCVWLVFVGIGKTACQGKPRCTPFV